MILDEFGLLGRKSPNEVSIEARRSRDDAVDERSDARVGVGDDWATKGGERSKGEDEQRSARSRSGSGELRAMAI